MEDRFGKYLRLSGTIFFLFIGFIITIILVLLGLRSFFGLMNNISWFIYAYVIFILLVPSVLFITCYIIYFRRTRSYPNAAVRWISYLLFTVALAAWGYFLFLDCIIFYEHAYTAISKYHSYDMIFLASNVACFFIVGVIQALATGKEQDWMDRRKNV